MKLAAFHELKIVIELYIVTQGVFQSPFPKLVAGGDAFASPRPSFESRYQSSTAVRSDALGDLEMGILGELPIEPSGFGIFEILDEY